MEGATPPGPPLGPGSIPPGGAPGGGGYPQGGQFQQGGQGGYGQPQYQGQQQGPGMGDRATEVVQAVGRHIRTPETKPFFKTSEFLVWLLTVLGVLIAGASVGVDDHGDVLRANTVWLLVTVISFAYIISRGISKAGTKYRDRDRDAGYGAGGFGGGY